MTSTRKKKKRLYRLLHPFRSYEILKKQHERRYRKFLAGRNKSIKSIKRKQKC